MRTCNFLKPLLFDYKNVKSFDHHLLSVRSIDNDVET